MTPAEILGAAQLFVAVAGLRLQMIMTPDLGRFFERTTDTRVDLGPLKIRRRTSIKRRR